MELQEVFDRVWQHAVIEKNPPSLSATGICLYRGENGAKCFIGLFLSDQVARTADKHILPVIDIVDDSPLENIDIDTLADLQQVHDDAAIHSDVDYFQGVTSRLKVFAEENGLTYSKETKL